MKSYCYPHQTGNKTRDKKGFTLVELLVVIAVISVLASLMLPALGRAKWCIKRTVCAGNMRQLALGSFDYASEDLRRALTGASDPADNDFNWIYPNYIKGVSIFRCPTAKNFIRTDAEWRRSSVSPECEKLEYRERLHGLDEYLVDLSRSALSLEGPGASYYVFGFMHNWGIFKVGDVQRTYSYQVNLGELKTEDNTRGRIHRNPSFGLKDVLVGPADIFHIIDQDTDKSHGAAWDFPDQGDPHKKGSNVCFVDGHLEFISPQDFLYRYEKSNDAGITKTGQVGMRWLNPVERR